MPLARHGAREPVRSDPVPACQVRPAARDFLGLSQLLGIEEVSSPSPKDAGGEPNGVNSRREAELAHQTASDRPVANPQPASRLHHTRRAHSGSRRTQPSRLPANLTRVPLADCGWASGLLFVHQKCTLCPMSPQPEFRMSVSNPPLHAAAPSPGRVMRRPLPTGPGARRPQPSGPPPVWGPSPRLVTACCHEPRPTVPCRPSPRHTDPDARVQAWLGAPQNRQKCAQPQLKSFLEKTLMRANPPHLASRTVPPTHPPAPPHSAMPGTATLAPRAATTTPGRSPSSNRSPLREEPR